MKKFRDTRGSFRSLASSSRRLAPPEPRGGGSLGKGGWPFPVFICLCLFSFPALSNPRLWPDGTALTIPKGRVELGLGIPLSYGLTDRLQLTSYWLWAPVVPNFQVKNAWKTDGKLRVAAIHRVYSPTPLLRLTSRSGIGGFLPPDNAIPLFLCADNYLVFTRVLPNNHLLTFRGGGKLSSAHGENSMETIDYYMLYARTAALHKGYSFDFALDLRGSLSEKWAYQIDSRHYFMPGMKGEWEWEPSANLLWQKSSRFCVMLGARYVLGEFPFGTSWILLPQLSLRWGFRKP